MNPDPVALRREVEIQNALGLHLRPAEKFVKTVDRFQSEVRVWYKGRSFDGRSILDLAMLAAERGTLLEIEAVGADAEAVLAALTELVAAQFFENEHGEEIGPKPSNGAAGGPAAPRTTAPPTRPQSPEVTDLPGGPGASPDAGRPGESGP